MNPGTLVRIPDAAPTRKGAKPKQRTAVVVGGRMDGYLMVEKCDRPGQWWIKENLVEAIAQ